MRIVYTHPQPYTAKVTQHSAYEICTPHWSPKKLVYICQAKTHAVSCCHTDKVLELIVILMVYRGDAGQLSKSYTCIINIYCLKIIAVQALLYCDPIRFTRNCVLEWVGAYIQQQWEAEGTNYLQGLSWLSLLAVVLQNCVTVPNRHKCRSSLL